MITKVSKISDDLFQINDCDIPIDRNSLDSLIKESSLITEKELREWSKMLNETGNNEFEDIFNTHNTSNAYEVEYKEPLKNDILGVVPEYVIISEERPKKHSLITEDDLKEFSKDTKKNRSWRESLHD
jgi:hypothetical protein